MDHMLSRCLGTIPISLPVIVIVVYLLTKFVETVNLMEYIYLYHDCIFSTIPGRWCLNQQRWVFTRLNK
ncbi:hypothetical protein BDV59DRAFT_174794 [Aspergillus ambiguus]|uniref:uncharacterized protein n=1 Tax=Aspergillus ambiguus TaxID=176160 RepID=UPI003CCE27A2